MKTSNRSKRPQLDFLPKRSMWKFLLLKVYLSCLPVMVHAWLSILGGIDGIPAKESYTFKLYHIKNIPCYNIETKRQTLTSVILLLKFLPHRQTWHWYRKLFLNKIIQTVNPSSYYILRGTAWLPHSYLHYCKHSASVNSPFAKLDLFSLLQRDELPSDEGVIERVHICGDEWTPPVHLRSDRMNTFKF